MLNLAAISTFHADAAIFLFSTIQLDMRYVSPPLPVDLNLKDASSVLKAAGLTNEGLERKQDIDRLFGN